MSSLQLLEVTGRRRSPAAMPGHNAGRAPGNKGMVYPADPPTVDEIVVVMRTILSDRHGIRLRALIVVLWRGGLRIQEALSLIESDLDRRRGAILVRRRKEKSAAFSATVVRRSAGASFSRPLCDPSLRSVVSARLLTGRGAPAAI
jgi:integrase